MRSKLRIPRGKLSITVTTPWIDSQIAVGVPGSRKREHRGIYEIPPLYFQKKKASRLRAVERLAGTDEGLRINASKSQTGGSPSL